MNHKDLKKLIQSYGAGGFWGRGIRLFDKEFKADMPIEEMNSMVVAAMNKLENEGLSPQTGYADDISDCDDWSFWIQAEVTKAWAKKMNFSGPALAFGRCNVPDHDLNCGITKDGMFVWNYGMLTQFDLKTITEVEFK